jgi:pimeloyl-ACP methyl ester carboxylesterase
MFAFDLPPPRARRAVRAGTLLLATTLALGACRDSHRPTTPLHPGTAAPAFSVDRPPTGSQSGIDPTDTHLMMEIVLDGSTTVNSPELITDPVTGAQSYEWTIDHERETMTVEMGYDHYGREIQDLRETTSMGDPAVQAINTTRRTWSVGEDADEIVRYDAHGNVVPEVPGGGDDCPYCIIPPTRNALSPSYVQITDGVVLDAAAIDALPTLSATAAPLAHAAGPGARVERTSGDRIRIVNDLSGGSAAHSATSSTGKTLQPERGAYVRSYRRSGSKYLLESTELTAEATGKEGARTRMRQSEQIRFVRLYENTTKDQARAALRARLGISETEARSFDWAVEPMQQCLPQIIPEPGCPGWEPPEPPPPAPDPCPRVPGGTNVLFQHGIKSDGGTWWRMDREWLCRHFATDLIERPSLTWELSIDYQRDQLKGKVPSPMQQIVLIGHSNGGLVSRAYAQWAQVHQPGRVKGVVTLDSPNQGAIVALNAKALAHMFSPVFGFLSWPLELVRYHPFYLDDAPGSLFLLRTNSFPETFKRVGIQTHAPKRWLAWRIVVSSIRPRECVPEVVCGERDIAFQAQKHYDRARHKSKFWYRPWQSIPAGIDMMWRNSADALWNGLTAPGPLSSDGFIHGPGQVYPGAQQNRLIRNGDSHVGTTRSPLIWDELRPALQDSRLFGLQPR